MANPYLIKGSEYARRLAKLAASSRWFKEEQAKQVGHAAAFVGKSALRLFLKKL